jgi:molecular chaperone GrpE
MQNNANTGMDHEDKKDQIELDENRAEDVGPDAESVEPQELSSTAPETPPLDPEEQISRLKLELDEYKDLYLRKAAEFENYKRRKQLEFTALLNSASEALITALLPILDDFDRLIENVRQNNSDSEAVKQELRGAEMIRDKLLEVLTARGLKPIESVGMPFDPELHEAMLQQQDSGTEAGIVLQEFQRGYRLGDKVIRHAKVVVSG